MAGHHHHHHLHHHPPPPPPPPVTPFCCQTSCCVPQPPSPDPLLEAILARLLQSPPPPETHVQLPLHRRDRGHLEQTHHHSVLSSLLYRIEALESSLYSISVSPTAHPLRDAAARVIQTHFRVFLARRSRTLRHLKDLASIKSRLTALKSSLSNGSRLNLASLSERAMDLLLKLDSIQDTDPMIRDGKRSITRDLDAFLEYIDGIAVKRHHLCVSSRKSAKAVGNSSKTRILREEREIVNNLKNRVERIRGLSKVLDNVEEDVELEGFHNFIDDGVENSRNLARGFNVSSQNRNEYLANGFQSQPRLRPKNVTFAENGNVYKIISRDPEPSSSGEDSSCVDGSVSSDDQTESSEKMKSSDPYGVKDYEEADLENTVASPVSSEGGVPSSWVRNEPKINIVRETPDQNVEFVFPAALPEKVDSREDLLKRRKALKIAG